MRLGKAAEALRPRDAVDRFACEVARACVARHRE
jgi:hypothetical protein